MALDERTWRVLETLKCELEKVYGDRLKGLYVYGSFARGAERPSSDLDVVYVLDRFDRPSPEIRRTAALVSRLSLDLGITISLVPIRESDLRRRSTLLARSVARESVAV